MFTFRENDGESEERVDAVPPHPHRPNKELDSSAGSSRSKLESEDSSYDSDYENSEPLASPGGKHEDVSRTVSDTLGAEFAEYVGTSSSSSTNEVFSHPDYANRIEFALKLGYTEKQAQVALHKLGPRPQQNELLAELIKLGACNPGKGSEGGGESGSGSSSRLESSSSSQQQAGCNALLNSRKLDSYPADGYELRAIVIDGSNVAMSHGNKEVFSCRGIKLCVDWFKSRGHRDITVFVPMWRKESSRPDAITKEQEILWELEKDRVVVFTPSRQMGGRRMACHDDRYILKLAVETDGVVVSNDNYRDLVNENPEFKKAIEERLLMYSFVNDRFMPPDDPLGRHGPSLDSFLCAQKKELFVRACPYGKKCTYGNKCKYYHPERGNLPHKSVSEQLAENAKIQIQEVKARNTKDHLDNLRLKATLSSPFPSAASSPLEKQARAKMPLQRTKSLLPSPLGDPSPTTLVTVTPPPDPNADSSPFGSRNSVWASPLYGDGGNHLSVAKRLSDPDNKMRQPSADGGGGSGGSNLHRKLQRQLTLNPVYDPRLVRIRHQLEQQGSMSEWDAQEHAPLVRHSSAGAVEPLPPRWGAASHQSVTRIASAPDSYHQWHHQDTSVPPPPHQYLWGPVMMPPPPVHPQPPQPQQQHMSFAEKRNHLFYHLSSIFPKEQVMAAMEGHPDETDAQAICAAMLNTFPPQHR